MNYKTKQILVVALAVLGAFAVNINTAETNKQIYLSDAAIPVASYIDTREQFINRVSRQRTPLTDKQLKRLLYVVGFRGKHLKEAWAIAKRETNGRPMAHNKNRHTGDNSYGLFQINMLGSLGEIRREKFGIKSNNELLDPVTNAQAAFYMTAHGTDFSSWGLGPNAYDGTAAEPEVTRWLSSFPK